MMSRLETITNTFTASATLSGRPWRIPLIAALALAFVSLALISGIAYIVVLAGATVTAERLLVDRAARVVDAQVALLRSRLDPVTEHLELVAALIAVGRLDIEFPVGIRETLAVVMTRVPAISTAAFVSFDLQLHRAQRELEHHRHDFRHAPGRAPRRQDLLRHRARRLQPRHHQGGGHQDALPGARRLPQGHPARPPHQGPAVPDRPSYRRAMTLIVIASLPQTPATRLSVISPGVTQLAGFGGLS